jgi:hypothetical protein
MSRLTTAKKSAMAGARTLQRGDAGRHFQFQGEFLAAPASTRLPRHDQAINGPFVLFGRKRRQFYEQKEKGPKRLGPLFSRGRAVKLDYLLPALATL